MSTKDLAGKARNASHPQGGKAGNPPLLGRKSVLMGILTSGFVVGNAAPAVAGTVKPIASSQPTYIPKWTPFIAYARGQQVVSSNNDVVSANVAHTSSSAYATDKAKWTLSSTYASASEPVALAVKTAAGLSGPATFTRSGTVVVAPGAARFLFNSSVTVSTVSACVGTAPAGANIIVDVNKNGATIFTTQANRPVIVAGTNATASAALPDVTSFAAGDYLTVDVDQVGTTILGSDLTVQIYYI